MHILSVNAVIVESFLITVKGLKSFGNVFLNWYHRFKLVGKVLDLSDKNIFNRSSTDYVPITNFHPINQFYYF